jgi:hypothetical protein
MGATQMGAEFTKGGGTMSMTEPGRAGTQPQTSTRTSTERDYSALPRQDRERGGYVRAWRETKPFFMTTEFWAMVAGIVALVVLYNVTDNPDMTLWRTSLLCTIIAASYIVSRGWAKSGSHDDHFVDSNR